MTNEAGYQVYVPTRAERFWRKVGFRFHLGDEPEGIAGMEGWSRTNTVMVFGFIDRLRLLLSGTLRTTTTTYYNAPSPSTVKTRIDWQIKAPGQEA